MSARSVVLTLLIASSLFAQKKPVTIDAVTQRDYPVIQGVILMSSFAYILVNFLIDFSYGLFDPRIRG